MSEVRALLEVFDFKQQINKNFFFVFILKSAFVTLAEWSNATDLRSVLFGGAGSNPAGDICPRGPMDKATAF